MSGTKKKRWLKRNPVSQDTCIEWASNKGIAIEKDGDWCWITSDGFDDAAEKELREYGFIKKIGYRALKSGNKGYWGHSCQTPTKFKFRKGKGKPVPTVKSEDKDSPMALLRKQLQAV